MALAYNKDNALNAICPYFTMFPLEYPLAVLNAHVKDRPVVLDPFCGRGTTLFAARKLGLNVWGIDSSPIAAAIAKAKLAACETGEPIRLAEQLINRTTPADIPNTDFFKQAFHPETLQEICALRESLMAMQTDTDASVILRAAALGCLHGPLSKNPAQAGYFSNQMPRTYASKPDYALRFWQERQLVAPRIRVQKVLQRKIARLQTGLESPSDNTIHQVLQGDSQREETYGNIKARPSLIITSPPYYGMRTYVQDQWLRNWFLGGPARVDYSPGPQLRHGGQQHFTRSLAAVWKNIEKIADDQLNLYVRFGIIPSARVDARELFLNSLEETGTSWKIMSVKPADTADAGKRQAYQMKAGSTAALEYDFHVQRP